MKAFGKLFVSLGLVLVASQLYAQPVTPDPTAGATARVSVSARLSVAEMTQQATELEAQVAADDRHVQHLQALARKDKDVIKLTCVNDKYVQLKAERNLFDNNKRDLLAGLDKDTRPQLFDAMSGSAANVRKAREEAERCMGEPELGVGESTNSFTPPTIPDDPTTGLPDETGTGGVIEPPGYASPYS